MIDGYTGFLYLDAKGMPEVAMNWEHWFNHAVNRYNEIYRVQMSDITPYICRHTYCSNQAKAGMNPKTLQYLMGHSDIGVTMNVYTHLWLEDAAAEMARMEQVEAARRKQEKLSGESGPVALSQKMFKSV
jgi:integrase